MLTTLTRWRQRQIARYPCPGFSYHEQFYLPLPKNTLISNIALAPAPHNSLQVHIRYHTPITKDSPLQTFQTLPIAPSPILVLIAQSTKELFNLWYPNALDILADPGQLPTEPVLELATTLWGPATANQWEPVLSRLKEALVLLPRSLYAPLQSLLATSLPPHASLSKKAMVSLLEHPDKEIRLKAIGAQLSRAPR